ncbi:MAG: glutathione S-transferase family protein [Alphaproteobacteria bacterium]
MSDFQLVIGNKNYSSWSLRAWLALRQTGADFEEILVPLDEPDTHLEILRHSPSGRVPCLLHEGRAIWDSLAICEYLAELFPEAGLWPADRAARAHARSISAEMHSGFAALRSIMPMNIRRKPGAFPIGEPVRADIARICSIWRDCCNRYHADDDPDDPGFLFGAFGAADAMYAPVVWRFHSYGVDLPESCAGYAQRIRALPAMKEWADAARDEPWVIESEEK